MKCLIVDDEPLAIEVIESHLEKLDDIEIVAKCTNALSAFEILQKRHVDLIFLDIQMPKLTGIDFLKTIQHPPKVIFTTAYREYAMEGYELNVVDYLLKPISFDRFLKAMSKAYEKSQVPLNSAISTAPIADKNDEYIYVKADKKMVKVRLDDVLYIEGLKDYVRIKTKEKAIVTYQKMCYLEEKLPAPQFLRTHRSYIVSISKVDCFCNSSLEVAGIELPIGRNYKNSVLKTLNDGHEL